MDPQVITILFDIDGTLIRTGGAGMLAIERAMKDMFDLPPFGPVTVHGRTDNGILNDLFSQQSLSFDEHREEFNQRYWSLLPDTLAQAPGKILPGVVELLNRLHDNANIALGILTGNSEHAASVKLKHFGLEQYFKFGGYGDVDSCRNKVAALALRSAEEHLNEAFDASRLWVVGDTVNDVTCARSIGSRVVAVETGGADAQELSAAKPDLLLSTLEKSAQFLQAISEPAR